MFTQHPELMNVFNVSNQAAGKQSKALFSAIAASATCVLEEGHLPLALLEGVNQKHCALNVIPAQYDVVGQHILGTIADLLNPGQEVLDAWAELYGALAGHCKKREEEIYKEAEKKAGGWRGMRKFKVQEKVKVSKNIIKFTFAPVDGKPVSQFKPGQYITVWTYPKGNDQRQPRHYSLIIEPRTDAYSIAVKKEPNGLVSSYLHDSLKVGDELNLSPPYGNFSIHGGSELWTRDPGSPIVLLSAGVGITAMLSMLGSLKNGVHSHERPVLWCHGARNSAEHAFRDYIVGLARAHPDDLTRRVWYSQPRPNDVKGVDNKATFHFEGHMNLNQVKALLPLGDKTAP